MIPHTLVLKPGLVIYRIYNGTGSGPAVGRPISGMTCVPLMSEGRPDWDLSAPGLREAWNAGDYSAFHGWNKRAKATPAGTKKGGG